MRAYYIEILFPTNAPDDQRRSITSESAQILRDMGIAAGAVAIDTHEPPQIEAVRPAGEVIPFYRPLPVVHR